MLITKIATQTYECETEKISITLENKPEVIG